MTDTTNVIHVSTSTMRDGQSTEEVVARFARLNEIERLDAAAQFADANATKPVLRTNVIGEVMSREARQANRYPMVHHEDVFLQGWREDHQLAAHSGTTWTVSWASEYSHTRLFPYLVTMLRVRDHVSRAELYRQYLLAEKAVGRWADDNSRFEDYFDHVHAFSSPSRPRILAGISMTPYLAWDWESLEGFTGFLRGIGLAVRIGLAEDQWYNGSTTPVVIWNPELVDVPRVDAARAAAVRA